MIKIGVVSQTIIRTGLGNYLFRNKNFYTETIPAGEILTPDEYTTVGTKLKHLDIILFNGYRKSFTPIVTSAIKKGIPVFLFSTEKYSLTELQEIAKFSSEAGTPVSCYNSFWFHPVFESFRNEIQEPFLCHFFEETGPGEPERYLSSLYYKIETSIMLSKGNFLKSSVSTYRLSNHKPDLFLVQLEFDSGAKTEILFQGTGGKEASFIFRQHGKIITWDAPHSKVTVKTISGSGKWKKKVRKFIRFSEGKQAVPWFRTFTETLAGKISHPGVDDRVITAQIFEDITSKITPLF